MKFFHDVADGHRKKNHIQQISQNANYYVKNQAIGKAFTSFFFGTSLEPNTNFLSISIGHICLPLKNQ